MRKRSLVLWAVLVLAGTACAKPLDPAASPTGSANLSSRTETALPIASPSPSPPISPAPEPAEPIILPTLPPQGVIVDDGKGVAFVAFDGRVIARIRHFSLYYGWTVPGPVILRHQRHYFHLRVGLHELRPLRSKEAAGRRAPQFQPGFGSSSDLPLQAPHGSKGRDGMWAYALPSPEGSALLEQWSGECEVPTAFLAAADGSDPRAVTGAWGLRHAGMSIGLGWTTNGRAVVNLLRGACGAGMGPPGIYLVDAPGEATLVHAGRASARMWGTA